MQGTLFPVFNKGKGVNPIHGREIREAHYRFIMKQIPKGESPKKNTDDQHLKRSTHVRRGSRGIGAQGWRTHFREEF